VQRSTFGWPTLILCFGVSIGVVSAQAPKDKGPAVRAKFTEKQIIEAEYKLKELSCSLHYEEPKKDELDEPPPKNPPRRQVDIVAIPETTSDVELAKMIPWLKRLPALRTIDLAQNRALTTKGYKLLTQVPDLQALMLDGTSITNDGLKELTGITSLHWLDISRTGITDAGIPILGRIERLQTLLIKYMPRLSERGLSDLKELKTLRVLHVTVEQDPPAMTGHIAKLKNLLELSIRPITNDETEQIARLDNLQILDVGNLTSDYGVPFRGVGKQGRRMPAKIGNVAPDKPVKRSNTNQITDAGLRSLAKLKNLRILDVSGNPVTVAGAKELGSLQNLEDLCLYGTDANDQGMEVLSRIRSLRLLDLGSTLVRDSGLRDLTDLPNLEKLYLFGAHIGDEGLREICRLRSLKELDLSCTRVTCANISELASLSSLRRLELRLTNVADAALPTIARIRSLRLLVLLGNCPNITHAAIVAFRKELPKCQVWYDSCETSVWPGVFGYQFRIPDFKYLRPVTNMPQGPLSTAPTSIPQGPLAPPLVPPNRSPTGIQPAPIANAPGIRVPTAGNGTAAPAKP
jgi:Leucine-rich repeat (LRR) protein